MSFSCLVLKKLPLWWEQYMNMVVFAKKLKALQSQYIYLDNKLSTLVFTYADLVSTGLLCLWSEQRQFLPRPDIHSPSRCLVWIKKCHVWLEQNVDPSLRTNKLWHVFMGMMQKRIKMANSKKKSFSSLSNSQYFLWKFYGLVLGLVELIGAKGIDVAQPIWSWGCPT